MNGGHLKKLHLKNFKSHKDTTLEFHSGVNAIIGLSAQGKSSIIRALDFVINNETRGKLNSHWSTDTEVTLDDVKRVKTKSKNEYYYGDDETPLTAFGTTPPQVVIDYFNMNKEINWQHQQDPIFMLKQSGGEIADRLNELIDMDIIKSSQKKASADIAALKANLQVAVEAITDSKTDYHSESHQAEKGLELLHVVRTKVEELEQLRIKKDNLTLHVSNITILEETQRDLVKFTTFNIDIEKLRNYETEIRKKRAKVKSIREYISNIAEHTKAVTKYKRIIDMEKRIVQVISDCEACLNLTTEKSNIETVLNNINAFECDKDLIEAKLIQMQKDFPETCPVCGGELKI